MTQEERLQQLEARLEDTLAALHKKIEHVMAYTEAFNATTRYSYRHAGNKHLWSMASYAMNTPTVRAEIGPMGLCDGIDAVHKLYAVGHQGDNEESARDESFTDGMGLFMAEHPLCTPIIEVAEDCETAKGVFISNGAEGSGTDEKGHRGFWIWMTPACEFCKEEGVWKVWHNHGMSTFISAWDHEWSDGAPKMMAPPEPEDGEDAPPPDKGMPKADYAGDTTFFQEYRAWQQMKPWPQPPEPYETYEGTQPVVGAPFEGYEIDG